MSKHTITIYERKDSSGAVTQTQSNTSSVNNLNKPGVSSRNIPKMSTSKNITKSISKFVGLGGAALSLEFAKKIINSGVNVYTTINAAATGNEIYNNNLRVRTNMILNPLSTTRDLFVQSFISGLVVSRQNTALEYQRQLTGNLAYSKKLTSGTF